MSVCHRLRFLFAGRGEPWASSLPSLSIIYRREEGSTSEAWEEKARQHVHGMHRATSKGSVGGTVLT